MKSSSICPINPANFSSIFPIQKNIPILTVNFQECPICFTLFPKTNFLEVCPQHHFFCKSCLEQYISYTISNNYKASTPICPQASCKRTITLSALEQTLDSQNLKSLSHTKIPKKEASNHICPKPGCPQILPLSKNSPCSTCKCGSKVCNTCGKFWHENKTCLEILDTEFETFAKENDIKSCIMCKSFIQRVEGCTHITCPICDYEWCWTCGREFTEDHSRNCPQMWKPEPPTHRQREDKNTHIEIKRKKSCLSKFFLCLFKLPFVIIFLPMVLCGCWERFKKAETFSERFCLLFFGLFISLIYQIAIAAFFMQLLVGNQGLYSLIALFPLVFLIFPCLVRIRRFGRKRKGVIPIEIKRWKLGNPELFRYSSSFKSAETGNVSIEIRTRDILQGNDYR